MRIGIVGPSYQELSLPFDAQRSVNIFPVADKDGKEVASMYSVPGKTLFTTAGIGPIRGMFYASNGRGFVVSAQTLYEVDSAGTVTSRGNLLGSSGIVTIDENGQQLAICDGQFLYIFTYATNVFAQVTDADFPSSVGSVCFLDGYFIVNQNDSNSFYISAPYDGLSWDPLDFASAESSPDNLVRVFQAVGQLWLLGETTTEIWTNTGESSFPFQKISGAKINVGAYSPYTTIEMDNTIFWVGNDYRGKGIVYRASGFRPQRISTSPIELKLQQVSTPEDLRAYAYQQDGHEFYVITGSDLETTLVYDVSSGLWHERASLVDGNYDQDKGCCSMYAFGKIYVGSKSDGKIFELDLYACDDAGDVLVRDRIYTHLSDEGNYIRANRLEIACEAGVGNQSDPAQNPLISMRLSKDGARTWTDWWTVPMGRVGEYNKTIRFRRLGIARQMTFQVRVTDPVKVAITGSYLF